MRLEFNERKAKQVTVTIVSYFFLKLGLFTELIFWQNKKRENNEFY